MLLVGVSYSYWVRRFSASLLVLVYPVTGPRPVSGRSGLNKDRARTYITRKKLEKYLCCLQPLTPQRSCAGRWHARCCEPVGSRCHRSRLRRDSATSLTCVGFFDGSWALHPAPGGVQMPLIRRLSADAASNQLPRTNTHLSARPMGECRSCPAGENIRPAHARSSPGELQVEFHWPRG
jgi:hypothetical protein